MKAYLFDVDGVLADPKVKQVTEPELYTHLIALLEAGEPVCLNTGRSLSWIEERVIDPLINRLKDKKLLTNFIAIGEKGGAWMTFDSTAQKKHEIDRTITVPNGLHGEVRELVAAHFSKSMFFDETKETMISVEMHDNFDIEAFHKLQKQLDDKLATLLIKHNASDSLKIEPTIIATDVENNHVGKAFGTDRFMQFLQIKGLEPDAYIAFGDSKSDIEMADELERRGKKVEFVFVGDKGKLDGVTKDYSIEFVSGFSQGTLAYLMR